MITTNEQISTVTTTVDDYLSAWNERDADRRAALIERVWAPDGRLIDPPLTGNDQHHDQLRFAWELVGPDGEVALRGLDVGELAADGRLQRITGFFGELPAMTDGA